MTPLPSKRPDQCCKRLAWSDIDPAHLHVLIDLAKAEDLNAGGLRGGTSTPGDHSSALLDAGKIGRAQLNARTELVVCGVELAPEILKAYDPKLAFTPHCKDGELLKPNESIGTVSGPVCSLLSAERPLLNFLQMLSGVSTETRRYVQALGDSSTRLLDTRKTTPGFRVLEKFAVACGGGWNHRIGLFDRVMLKDNHIAAFGADPLSATIAAVSESRRRNPKVLVEMEVDALEQIEIALTARVDIILLDNFPLERLREAVSRIGNRAVTEASGGITLDALPELATLGLDFISTGALVHKSSWVDIGLDWK